MSAALLLLALPLPRSRPTEPRGRERRRESMARPMPSVTLQREGVTGCSEARMSSKCSAIDLATIRRCETCMSHYAPHLMRHQCDCCSSMQNVSHES